MDHSDSVKLDHVLQCNLAILARFNPTSDETKRYISEGMFKTPNQKYFYEVVHFLLNLVDPKRCKEKFYWPLLDRETEQEFRKAIPAFIAQINKDDANACIPAITASMLHYPSGDKIVKFLIQLTQYTLKKALQTNFKTTEIMHQPQNLNNPITSRILAKVLRKKTQDEKENVHTKEKEHKKYTPEAWEQIETQDKTIQELVIQIKKNQQEFKTFVGSSHVPGKLKMRTINGDSSAIEEWTNALNEEIDIYETKVLDLERIIQKISDFRILVENAEEWKKSPPCLDGERLKLNIPACISESLTVPVYNLKGELSLDGFLNCTKHLSEELRKEVIKKYPKCDNDSDAKLLYENLINNSVKINKLENLLGDNISEVKTLTSLNQSKVYLHYEDFNETVFENIYSSPEYDFMTSLNTSNLYLGAGDGNQLLGAIKEKINKKRKLSIVCSIKHKTYSTSTKTASKIPKYQNKLTKPKKLIYSQNTSKVQKRKSINNEAGSKKLQSTDVPLSTPLQKKRRSRISVSPTLESIPDFINDISFSHVEQEVNGLLSLESYPSTPQILSYSWRSSMDLIETLEKSSLPDESINKSLLNLSQSTVEGSDLSFSDHNQSEIIYNSVEQQNEEPPNRRASLQAIIDKYKLFQKKINNIPDYK